MKYTEELKTAIFTLVAEGTRTQKQICDIVNISEETFITWRKDKPEFSELLKAAEEEKWNRIKALLPVSITKLAQGYEVEYTESYGVVDKKSNTVRVTNVVKKKKVFAPNPAVNIFLLNNLEKQMFKNSGEITHILPVKPPWMNDSSKPEPDVPTEPGT